MFLEQIKDELTKHIKKAYPQLNTFSCQLVSPPSPDLGHFAFGCFFLAKELKQSPTLIAQKIVENFTTNKGIIDKIENKQGYLNLFLNYKKLANNLLKAVLQNSNFGASELGKGKTVLIEFSSPNTNKPLHLGHARNNAIGSSLTKILQWVGYKVIKANLINDRGIHICQSMLAYSLFGEQKTPESEKQKSDHFVGDYYVLFHQKKEKQPELIQKAGELLQKWEKKDPTTLQLWKKMNKWALHGILQTYQHWDIFFNKFYFESDTYLLGKQEVEKALKKKLCYKNEEGAVVISLEDKKLGKKVLLRADGTSVYITQDIFASIKKYKDFSPDFSLFVVGSEQKLHFQILFAILEKFGFSWAKNCKHISYGMIALPDGKMKSREGKVVDLDNLVDEVKKLALIEIQKRNPEKLEKMEEKAEKMARGALNFFILKTQTRKDFIFEKEKSLSFEGNTGTYLQYTYARICSLLKKNMLPLDIESGKMQDWNEVEIQILQTFLLFPQVLEKAAIEYEPSLIANFVLGLCRNFNKFYYEYPILQSKKHRDKRVLLTSCTKNLLEKSMQILGVPLLNEM